MKTYIKEPRPFWISPELYSLTCDLNFGNPSGHSSGTMGKAMLLYLDYATFVFQGKFSSLPAKLLMGVLTVTLSMTVAYSRLVLNVHTIN